MPPGTTRTVATSATGGTLRWRAPAVPRSTSRAAVAPASAAPASRVAPPLAARPDTLPEPTPAAATETTLRLSTADAVPSQVMPAAARSPQSGGLRLTAAETVVAAPPRSVPRLFPAAQVEETEPAAPAPRAKPERAVPDDDADRTSPSFGGPLAKGPDSLTEPCPKPSDLKRIDQITTDISIEAGELPQECTLGDEVFAGRAWLCQTHTWKASALCHKPLYFEEVALERYGHSTGRVLQPLVSGAHFFGTIPLLPYKSGIHHCCECQYALGYYRPGSCAPYHIPPLPLSLRGAAKQTGAVLGVHAILPIGGF